MDQSTNRFEYAAKIVLYVIAALLPIWFVPVTLGVDFGREITFGALIVVATLLWLVSVLTKGELRYQHSPLLWAAGFMLAVFAASTIFSKAPLVSFIFGDPVAERFSTVILGVLLMVVLGGILRTRAEVALTMLLFILTSAVSGVLNLLQIFGVSFYKYFSVAAAQTGDFNVVGTQNGLAIFFVAVFMLTLGLIFSRETGWKSWLRYGLVVAALVFLANLILIHFQISWIVFLGSTIFLFGVAFRSSRAEDRRLDWRYWVSLTLLALSLVMIMVRGPLFPGIEAPLEVSPSFKNTLNIALSVYKEGVKQVFLGSGPATFPVNWSLYKDPSINNTVFWNVRFNQGFSWFSTLLSAGGLLGVFSLFIFLGTALALSLRSLLGEKEDGQEFLASLFFGLGALILAVFLYPANFTLILFLFMSAGLISLLLKSGKVFWSAEERILKFKSPWSVFLASLVTIFFLSLGVTAVYGQINRARAALVSEGAFKDLNRGLYNEAIEKFGRAAALDSRNFYSYQNLVTAQTEKVKQLILAASRGADVQQEFQATVSSAVQNSQRALQIYPVNTSLWRTQATLYEVIIPFIQGAEKFAFESYRKAAELDPFNPSLYADWGRAALVYADRLQLLADQSKGPERERLLNERRGVLEGARTILEKGTQLKPDFAQPQFLLTQVSLRLGDIKTAIQSAENVKLSAPFDLGVAFQLGLLYYQNNQLDKAETEFRRALSLNRDYSNARYFLGLIFDRRGNKKEALQQFEDVLKFNPGNEEVLKIISNLKKGKKALDGVTPLEKRQGGPALR